ncbi:hypothetical protein V6N12_018957 [Hibiscus sabdariffa]|uniref:Uncharacterized protein n=1 Tax=Hibiscus sabdariffa TaxID=183260 RepID=A0ABR2AZU5_9ROSI
MANRKIPELARCIEDDEPQQQVEDQLTLNEDGAINTAIKNHSLVASVHGEGSLPDCEKMCKEDEVKLASNNQELLQLEQREDEVGHHSIPKTINGEDSMILESQIFGDPPATHLST